MTSNYKTRSNGGVFRRRGSALVEFALVIPVLLALLIGTMEFGWLIRNQLAVANAVREGVRHAALGNPATSVRQRIINSASNLVPAIQDSQITLEQTADRTSSSPTYSAWPADTTAATPRNGVAAGSLIRITVRYPHRQLTNFFPFLRNRIILVPASMAREGTG